MKTDWNSVWFKVRVAPLDWLRLYANWFPRAARAFLRVGPVELSMQWGLDEAHAGCAPTPPLTAEEK